MKRKVWVRGSVFAAVLAVMQIVPVQVGAVQVTAFKQAVAEAIAKDDEIAAIYRKRGFEPIWTGDGEEHRARRAALVEILATARHHGLPVAKYAPDLILSRLASVRSGYELGATDVALSKLFLDFARDLNSGVIDTPRRIDAGIARQIIRRDASFFFDGLLGDDPRRFVGQLAPQSLEYASLMKAKLRLEQKVARGGWGPQVGGGRKLEPGDSGGAVIALRDRLIAKGYLAPTVTAVYDDAITQAVQLFQVKNGMEADGVAGPATLAEINKSALERLQSVMVAMERERWINRAATSEGRVIKVNLTDFKARIYDDGKLTFETRSVIGHQDVDRRTPEFSDEMTHMVINPSWYVPRSIIVKEYLPKLRANSGAVSHLQITDSRGRVVGRGQSFAEYTANSFPFAMKQPPGPRNALGTVKFMFPNKHNIYLHDTPAKSLFAREVRTYSHGCVRLNDPHDFAYTLLSKQTDDPEGFFHARLRTGAETRVNLDQSIPVHLIYRTAFATEKGDIEFRRDMYGRDAKIWQALEAAGVEIGGIQS